MCLESGQWLWVLLSNIVSMLYVHCHLSLWTSYSPEKSFKILIGDMLNFFLFCLFHVIAIIIFYNVNLISNVAIISRCQFFFKQQKIIISRIAWTVTSFFCSKNVWWLKCEFSICVWLWFRNNKYTSLLLWSSYIQHAFVHAFLDKILVWIGNINLKYMLVSIKKDLKSQSQSNLTSEQWRKKFFH